MFTFIFTFTRWHNPLDWGLVSSVATCLVPWSVIQQQCNMCMRPEFMTLTSCDSVLLHVWHGLEQSLIDDSIDQWRMRLCSCQWWTFWTYFVTMNLFSLYLMNFMFHTMLDAECIILRVHYTSMKCDVSFSLCSVSTLFRWSGHLCHIMCKTVLPAYNGAKIIKINQDFPELWSQIYCLIFWFTVYVWVYAWVCACVSGWRQYCQEVSWNSGASNSLGRKHATLGCQSALRWHWQVCPSVCPSVRPSVCPSGCFSLCLSVCLSVFVCIVVCLCSFSLITLL